MKKLLLILLFGIFNFAATAQKTITGICTRIVDGDTYEMTTPKGNVIKIRDSYINTPENKNAVCSKQQPYAMEATSRATQLLLQQKVSVKVTGIDVYGRTLGYARVNKQYFHKIMLLEGYAWSYEQKGINYNRQQKSKKYKRGLWGIGNAVNPSVWLKIHSTRK